MNTSEHTPQHASHTPEERSTSTVQKRSYTEHRILRGAYGISAHHYAGTGPALVLMHGFPDNLHIYDRLIPYLRDRQVITFDFLGWGTSDKPTDYPYTSKQQEGDLKSEIGARSLLLWSVIGIPGKKRFLFTLSATLCDTIVTKPRLSVMNS